MSDSTAGFGPPRKVNHVVGTTVGEYRVVATGGNHRLELIRELNGEMHSKISIPVWTLGHLVSAAGYNLVSKDAQACEDNLRDLTRDLVAAVDKWRRTK